MLLPDCTLLPKLLSLDGNGAMVLYVGRRWVLELDDWMVSEGWPPVMLAVLFAQPPSIPFVLGIRSPRQDTLHTLSVWS